MPSVDLALEYAERGIAVLPVYPPKGFICSCPLGGSCRSPGKHPFAPTAPNGVSNATSDDEDVRRAFPRDDLNIGVACGTISGGLMVQDIDDEEVAGLLLNPDFGLGQITLCSTSGRGPHIWLYTSGATKGHNLSQRAGGPIGELRGDGQYVVAPPSKHYSGKEYVWIDPTTPIVQVDDARLFIVDLLKRVGIEVELEGHYNFDDLPPDLAVLPIDLPTWLLEEPDVVKVAKAALKRPASGPNRSKDLFYAAHLILEKASVRGQDIDRSGLAGVLKRIDTTGKGYQKYSDRTDADLQYLRLAEMAVQDNERKLKGSVMTESYSWDRTANVLNYTAGRSNKKVANFMPLIEEALEIDRGDQEEPVFAYTVSLTQGESVHRAVIRQENRQKDLEDAIFSDAKTYIVQADGWPHVWPAAQEFSAKLGTVKARRSYQRTGWVTEGDPRFLLPGLPGAITAGGIDTSTRFEDEDTPKDFTAYGHGVRPAVENQDWQAAEAVLHALLKAGAPKITIPVLSQVFGGPLFSLGLSSSPPLVHLTGETGSFKTSYCMAALSLFGQFTRDSRPPDNYGSTIMAIQHSLYYLRDLTVLIDNFIPGRGGQQLVDLVQMYGDGSGRARMTQTAKRRSAMLPRGLWLSTGESTWGENVSVRARTIAIWCARGDIDRAALTTAQELVAAGHAGLIGGSYLSWLAAQGIVTAKARLEKEKLSAHEFVSKTDIAKMHDRPVQSLANLIASYRMALAFVKERMPSVEKVFAETAREGFNSLLTLVEQETEEATHLSAFNQVVEAIRSNLAAGTVQLQGRLQGDLGAGMPHATVIGWADAETIYLNIEITFGWYLRELARQGVKVSFNWNSFLDEAVNKHKATRPRQEWTPLGKAVRVMKIAREEILPEAIDGTGK